ncbi:MAG: Hpt domain-containing protein [Alphaproteobacteria bacterium]|nr:Hpt domain-containing protein [Alphaproteobacteria bacterium]
MKRKAGSFIRVSEKGYTYEEIVVADDLKTKMERPEGIPPDAARIAQQAVERLQDEFVEWARRDIARLAELAPELASAPSDAAVEETRQQARIIAHDLRGQGATFGYPLVTEIATCLGTIMRLEKLDREMQQDMLQTLAEMMREVIEQRMRGDGGASGEKLRKKAHRMAVLAADPARGGPAAGIAG